MFSRIAAALFALTLVLTTGAGPAFAHFCAMTQSSRGHCCCHKSQAERADQKGPQFERDMRCCQLRVTDPSKPTVLVRDAQTVEQPLLGVVATLPSALTLPTPRSSEQFLPLGARAPPVPTGPPLFIRNLSLLI